MKSKQQQNTGRRILRICQLCPYAACAMIEPAGPNINLLLIALTDLPFFSHFVALALRRSVCVVFLQLPHT